MITKSDVEDYYNKTWKELDEKGLTKPNTRHFIILDRLRKIGLKRDSKVLEVGCGIGTLSSLISRYLRRGSLTAIDISPETIELARRKFRNLKNIDFMVSDMSDWESQLKFDFIILPDVIEHIPFEQHKNLFQRLKDASHENTLIAINIPHPKATEYWQSTKPELLQIIDLQVHTDHLCKIAYPLDYYIDSLESYSISCEDSDYQFIVLKNQANKSNFKLRTKPKLFLNFWKYRLKSWG